MTFIKAVMIFFGTVSLFIGVLGIFIPGLPTTPFLLLTAALFIRSSDKLYHRLITNKYLGSYIQKFRLDKGVTKRVKLYSILTMWMMIIVSCLFLINVISLILVVLVLGIIGTIVMWILIPTVND
jgi:uncharacterized membrane protein YbaN (DUF454 family)